MDGQLKGLEYHDWMEKADGNRDLARQRYNYQNHPDISCYHVQQAMEKYLKAQIVSFGCDVQKTHNISTLLDDLTTITNVTFDGVGTAPGILSGYEVSTRYPGFAFAEADYQAAVRAFDRIASVLRSRGLDIPAWDDPCLYIDTPDEPPNL